MISAATWAMALLMVTLVKDHGLQYLLATTILTGLLQIIAGYLKLGSLMSFVSRTVVIGSLIPSPLVTIDRFGIHDKPSEIEKVMGGH